MDLPSFMSNLTLGETNVYAILSSPIDSPAMYSKAIQKATVATDAIMDMDARSTALAIIAASCIELYKWFLPHSNGITSADLPELRDKYDYVPDHIKSSLVALTSMCSDFEITTPTRKCSIAIIARGLLQSLTPRIDAWQSID